MCVCVCVITWGCHEICRKRETRGRWWLLWRMGVYVCVCVCVCQKTKKEKNNKRKGLVLYGRG